MADDLIDKAELSRIDSIVGDWMSELMPFDCIVPRWRELRAQALARLMQHARATAIPPEKPEQAE